MRKQVKPVFIVQKTDFYDVKKPVFNGVQGKIVYHF